MSTCPEKDIHSIYLDNELPGAYVEEYEKHIKNCVKCQEELSKLKRIKEALKQDSLSLNLSQASIDESFKRLQARMSYSKVISSAKTNTKKHIKVTNNKLISAIHDFDMNKLAIPFAAAAAFVAALVLPIGKTAPVSQQEIASAAQDNSTSINASLNTPAITPVLNSSQLVHNASFSNDSKKSNGLQIIQDSLKSVDVFRPEFTDKTVSIKITLSSLADMPPVRIETSLDNTPEIKPEFATNFNDTNKFKAYNAYSNNDFVNEQESVEGLE
ncbi:MAG: hypothetical protein K6F69_07830 [Treponema sp.]|nr:hypothetical protein [Treponema sp.]